MANVRTIEGIRAHKRIRHSNNGLMSRAPQLGVGATHMNIISAVVHVQALLR